MSCDCFKQEQKTVKRGELGCFVCVGDLSGVPRLLKMGINYQPCSPLVHSDPDDKGSPLTSMRSADECIVAFVGHCGIDASEWTEDCKAPVYDDVDVIKQCVNWPEDENGDSIFSLDDLERIYSGHTCCIRFHDTLDCARAPEWLADQQVSVK